MPPTFPAIYLLKAHFQDDPQELHRLEKEIGVVWDIKEAELVLGRVGQKRRAQLELSKLGLNTVDAAEKENSREPDERGKKVDVTSRKRRKVEVINVEGKEIIALDSGSEIESDSDTKELLHMAEEVIVAASSGSPTRKSNVVMQEQVSVATTFQDPGTIKVLKLAWYLDSLQAGKLLPFESYLVYEGRIETKSTIKGAEVKTTKTTSGGGILARAKADSPPPTNQHLFHKQGSRSFGGQRTATQRAHLVPEMTVDEDLPPVPDYLLNGNYSCQRPTPLRCPNEAFLSQLRIIKKARLLNGDKIGLLAYSAAIASIASYPYTLTSAYEVSRLPKCGNRYAALWEEWTESGRITEVVDTESDSRMQSLNIFYDIHDVAEVTARHFYQKGWRDLDDIVEKGWDTLTRNQQIGVKFYEEFKQRIPRAEVESISDIILQYANKLRSGFQMVIVGGYRRGKLDSGDVDVVISHPDEDATEYFLQDLLESLEADDWITHRLEVASTNSNRGQSPLNWKGGMPRHSGSGFDTLDHAFIVWQNQIWPSMEDDSDVNMEVKNPNPHRRVDIIVAPWKTAGCAVVGWSGGTMFERDIRRYCREQLKYKFDSSGVRRLDDGEWVDLERGDGDMLVKEKRVFEGLGLEWREPTERCTD